MSGIQHRSLMPVVYGVRDTSPPTPRKASVEPRQGVRGRSKNANRGLNDHEQREVRAGYAKWYLDQAVPLPRKVIAARTGFSLDVINNMAQGRSFREIPQGRSFREIPPMKPQDERKAA